MLVAPAGCIPNCHAASALTSGGFPISFNGHTGQNIPGVCHMRSRIFLLNRMRSPAIPSASQLVLLLGLVLVNVAAWAVGGSTSVTTNNQPPNPVLRISVISPRSATAGGAGLTL